MDKQKILEEARTAGECDEWMGQQLTESALEYFLNEVETPEDMSDEDRDKLQSEVIEQYDDGFCGRKSPEWYEALQDVISFAEDHSPDVFEGEEWQENYDDIMRAVKTLKS